MINYKEKYLKYKEKYLSLKNLFDKKYGYTQSGGRRVFKIYTSGMVELRETWNYFLRERIIGMIPDYFDSIEIMHYDNFHNNQVNPSVVQRINRQLYEGDLNNPRVTSSHFFPVELPIDELRNLETSEPNTYIYLDFAHLLDYPPVVHQVISKYADPTELFPLSAIYFGFCGTQMDAVDGSSNFDNALNLPFFKFEEDGRLVTYLDHLINLGYRDDPESPGNIFRKIINKFKINIFAQYKNKYTEQFRNEGKSVVDQFDKKFKEIYNNIFIYLMELIFDFNLRETEVLAGLEDKFSQEILN